MSKADLHRLVDELPEDRAEAARQILEFLRGEKPDELTEALLESPRDPLLHTLVAAPEDDEPESPEEAEAVQEAREDLAAGRVMSHGRSGSDCWGCLDLGNRVDGARRGRPGAARCDRPKPCCGRRGAAG